MNKTSEPFDGIAADLFGKTDFVEQLERKYSKKKMDKKACPKGKMMKKSSRKSKSKTKASKKKMGGHNKIHVKGNLYKIKIPSCKTFRYAIKLANGRMRFISEAAAKRRGGAQHPPHTRKQKRKYTRRKTPRKTTKRRKKRKYTRRYHGKRII